MDGIVNKRRKRMRKNEMSEKRRHEMRDNKRK